MIEGLTLHQLQCFDAVVAEGGFQQAAEKLRRTQPTVFAAVKNLESQLGLVLLDRSGYRVALCYLFIVYFAWRARGRGTGGRPPGRLLLSLPAYRSSTTRHRPASSSTPRRRSCGLHRG